MTLFPTTIASAEAGEADVARPAASHAPTDNLATKSDATPRRAVHIPALDGLRGLAIILVLFFHFTLPTHGSGPIRRIILYLTGAGWVGVDLFFVLSGFLITSILFDAKNTEGYFRNFYMRRVLRIFPLYYGVLIVAFVLIPLVHPFTVKNQWALWLYLANYFPPHESGFIHFWSLAVEEQYYMIWPAVVFLLGRRTLMGVCIAMIFSALAFRFGRVATGMNAELTYYATYCRMDSLAIGALLALASRSEGGMAALAKPAKLAGIIAFAGLSAIYVWNKGFFNYAEPKVQSIGYTLLGMMSGSLLVLAVLSPRMSLPGRFFNNVVLRFFGKYSYGIYVIHGLLHLWLYRQFPLEKMPKDDALFYIALVGRILLGTGISVAGALLSWHLFEKHFLKLKRFFEYRAKTLSEPVNDAIAPPNSFPSEPAVQPGR